MKHSGCFIEKVGILLCKLFMFFLMEAELFCKYAIRKNFRPSIILKTF